MHLTISVLGKCERLVIRLYVFNDIYRVQILYLQFIKGACFIFHCFCLEIIISVLKAGVIECRCKKLHYTFITTFCVFSSKHKNVTVYEFLRCRQCWFYKLLQVGLSSDADL